MFLPCGGPAARAEFNNPNELHRNRFGNLYIVESSIGRIHKINRLATSVIEVQAHELDLGPAAVGEVSVVQTFTVRNRGFLPLTATFNTLHTDVSVSPNACILPPEASAV